MSGRTILKGRALRKRFPVTGGFARSAATSSPTERPRTAVSISGYTSSRPSWNSERSSWNGSPSPSGNSPFFMRVNRSRFSSTDRLRNGLSLPGRSGAPRYDSVSAGERSQT